MPPVESNDPNFITPITNPFGLTNVGYISRPTFADIDGDGDLDAFVGNSDGDALFFRNTGTASAPTFTLEATNPFGLTDVGYIATPTFADIDGDGDLDAFVGNSDGDALFFRNTGTASAPTFTLEATNPFGLTNVGLSFSKPTFADIDGDGDLDAFVGNSTNTVFYRNIGTTTAPAFTEEATNPFGLVAVGFSAAPTFADIDGDGDLDAFVGNFDGNTVFYRNSGTATAPAFTEEATNPFGLADVGFSAAPTFADIDGDGDLDTFVGNSDGNILFFENVPTTSVNNAPVGSPTATLGNTAEDTAITINAADLLTGFSDVDGDTLSVTGLTADNGTLVDNGDGTYTFTPTADFNGTVTLDYGVSDGTDTLTGQTQTFSVTAVNTPTGDPNFIAPVTNPFGLTNAGFYVAPTLADIDNDGDLDAFVGNRDMNILFYRNTGTATDPTFTLEATDPFGLTNVTTFVVPTFADIDNDGDLDAFVGNTGGNTQFYRNTGTATDPTFTLEATNPFGLTDVGFSAKPTFADIDNDGDLDAFVGNRDGNLLFYRNTGTATDPTFTLEATNPFGLTDVGFLAAPIFGDIDGDGDLDAFVGSQDGNTLFFRNSGTATAPAFTEEATNPFGLTDVGFLAAPTLADIDGDGDLDAFVGELYGNILFFENVPTTPVNNAPVGSPTATLGNTAEDTAIIINAADLLAGFSDVDAGDTLSVTGLTADNGTLVDNGDGTYSFTPTADFNGAVNLSYGVTDGTDTLAGQTQTFSVTAVNDAPIKTVPNFITPIVNPFGLTNVGYFAAPTFADIDGDGDLDAFVGNSDGNTLFFRNTGTASAPTFTSETSNFGLTDVGDFAVPTFADIDGDGDLDAFVGNSDGNTLFFRNTGTATAPTFTSETSNFGLTNVGDFAAPTFADIDGDGDLDAFVGERYGETLFFRNTGTATAPTFTSEASNFGLTNVGDSAAPTLADIDGDGDLDAFVGNKDGNTLFFRNTGTASAPTFTLETSNFGLTDVVYHAVPTFADIDGDGDLDAFVGNVFGETLFFENQRTATTAEDIAIIINAADLLADFSDVDGDTLSVTGLTADNGTLVDNGDGTYSFTPTADFNGTVTLTYGVTDGTDTLSGQTLRVYVTPVNDAPVGSPTATLSNTAEDTAIIINAADLLTGFSDVEGDTLSVTGLTANNGGLVDNGDGTYTFTPTANFNGVVTLDYSVSDGTDTLTGQTQTFSVTAVNDAPVGSPTATLGNTAEDTAVIITAADLLTGFSDVEGDTLSVVNLTADNGGLVDNLDGTYSFTPTADFNGAVTLDYGVSDGTDTLTGQTQTFSVTAVNDAPIVANAIANQTILEDGFFSFTLPANTFADVDAGDSLIYTASLANGDPLPTWLSFDANTQTFSGTPDDPDNGTISIKVTATDTSNASVDNTFNLTVTPVNDAPVAGDDSFSANQNTPLTLLSGDLLANDVDVDGGALSITAVSNGVNGSVTINSSGDVIFTPTTGFSGNGSFNYTVSDGNGGTDLGMVTVAVGIDLNGTNQDDTINGTSGNDIINALNGDDIIFGNAGNDNLVGGNGNDTLYGGTANDQIYGGNGNDDLYGEAGNDRLEGDNGDDNLYGGDGNDTLLGGNGKDLLVGGAGNDFLNGGKQDDILTGGTGSDIFVLETAAGRDTITDFSLGQDDKIGLSGLSFSQLSFAGDEIRFGNQTLGILTGFDTTTLTQNNFISV
ncbi:cadherin-like domain-containing protein [Anabaena minutissima FACHB-250]|nr:cadherin-like domain-containing protein [Anabaena minutissima FACHB-250]